MDRWSKSGRFSKQDANILRSEDSVNYLHKQRNKDFTCLKKKTNKNTSLYFLCFLCESDVFLQAVFCTFKVEVTYHNGFMFLSEICLKSCLLFIHTLYKYIFNYMFTNGEL